MPSIFIWKSNELNASKKQVRYYSGSNWFLEDNDFSSKSYMLLDQTVINAQDNTQVITFHAKKMPQDWVGSELLEVIQVSYEQIKSDNYGTLERVGEWIRFISTTDIEFDSETLQNEFVQIKKWMTKHDSVPEKVQHHSTTSKFVQKPTNYNNNYQTKYQRVDPQFSSDNIQHNFQEFLNKYNVALPTELLLNQSTQEHYTKSNINMHNKNTGYKNRYNKKL